MEPILTLATVPAVLALVNVTKQFGLSGKWATLAAIVLGVAVVAGATFAPTQVWQVITEGLLLGLAAAGVYDVATPAKGRDID